MGCPGPFRGAGRAGPEPDRPAPWWAGVGEGDRVQKPLAGGIAEGFMVDGSRSWTGHMGRTWDLAIDSVEMRWADPVPQAGSYTLESPEGKTLSLSFSRIDSDSIEVTVTGPRGRAL